MREHLDMRFCYLPGNNDVRWKEKTGLVSKERWEARFGRTYRHFAYQDGTPLDPRIPYGWLPEWGMTGDDGKTGGFARASR